MQQRHMAHEHVFADDGRIATRAIKVRIAVYDGAVLDVAARADADCVDVAAQHAIEPDACLRADRHLADDLTPRRDEGRVMDDRHGPVKRDEISAVQQ